MASRLEELSEARQGMVAKVKAAKWDRDMLEGAKTAAEACIGKERCEGPLLHNLGTEVCPSHTGLWSSARRGRAWWPR